MKKLKNLIRGIDSLISDTEKEQTKQIFALESIANLLDVAKKIEDLKKTGKKNALLLLTDPQGSSQFVTLAIE